jgi:hypothetical protein
MLLLPEVLASALGVMGDREGYMDLLGLPEQAGEPLFEEEKLELPEGTGELLDDREPLGQGVGEAVAQTESDGEAVVPTVAEG